MSDEVNVPGEISFDDDIMDADFHPSQSTRQCIVASDIQGNVFLHSVDETPGVNRMLWSNQAHSESCRCSRFSKTGAAVFCGSSDLSVSAIDVASGNLMGRMANAHNSAVNCILPYDENVMISGDDDGCIKAWDTRSGQCALELAEHEDFIADMMLGPDGDTLLTASGDGCLGVFSLRKQKLLAMSDNMEDELLSLAVMKGGRKLVAGTQEGLIGIFSWDDWGDFTDRLPGHPQSVDTIVPLSSDIIATGSSDGLIRVVSILPNRLLGVLGEHSDFPIERLCVSPDGQWVASCSHDATVKFWEADVEDDGQAEGDEADAMSDSDSDDDQGQGSGKQKKKHKAGKQSMQASQQMHSQKQTSDFFKDL